MEINIVQISAAVVAAIAPFMPFLTEMGKVGGKKLPVTFSYSVVK